MLKYMNLRNKILMTIGIPALLIMVILAGVLVFHMRDILRDDALALAESAAHRFGSRAEARLESAIDSARAVAQMLGSMNAAGILPDREALQGIIIDFLNENHEFLGVWMCWEAEIVTGAPDAPYTPGWHRFYGSPRYESLEEFDAGAHLPYYDQVKEARREAVTEPMRHPRSNGFYTVLIAPVFHKGSVIGSVGIAFSLEGFREMGAGMKPFSEGYGFMISGDGTIASHPVASAIGRPITDFTEPDAQMALLQALRNGLPHRMSDLSLGFDQGRYVYTFAPITIGRTERPWSYCVAVPSRMIDLSAHNVMTRAAVTGTVAILCLILIIFAISRQIVRPLYKLVEVSKSLAAGNFGERADLSSRDEFGMATRYIDKAFDIVVDKMYWYEGMLDAIPFPVSVTDAETRWTFLNKKAEELLGGTRSKLYGKRCSEWPTPICDNVGCGIRLLREGVTTTTFHNAETDRYFQIDTAWLHNTRNERVGHIEIFQDITEAVRLKGQAEEQSRLQRGEAELYRLTRGENALDTAGQRIISFACRYVDAQVGLLYLMDEKEERLYGIAAYACKDQKATARSFATGEGLVGQVALEKSAILLREAPRDYLRVESGLGESAPVNIIVLPMLFEERVKGVIEIGAFRPFSDTDRRFLENAAQHAGFVIHMVQSRNQMKDLLKRTRAQAEAMKEQQKELRQTNEELESQTQALRASEASLQSQQEELRIANEELEARTRDLEEQRDQIREKNLALQQARKEIARKAHDLEMASQYKSEFMANMSHELRTPLNSILILSQLLSDNKERTLSDKQVDFARTIHSSGEDLLSLINEILDLSKVEAGKLEIVMEEVSVQEMIENVRRTFSPMAEQKGLDFGVSVAPEVAPYIKTDGKRLWQILKNLLSNAVKFTDDGGVSLEVFRFSAEGPNSPVEGFTFRAPSELSGERGTAFSVTDSGIGIPADKREIIFEAFRQVDGRTNRRYGGTGLGLSISREFARYLGGDIRLDNPPAGAGSGSRFTLYLPDADVKAEPTPDEVHISSGDALAGPTAFEPIPEKEPLAERFVAQSAGPDGDEDAADDFPASAPSSHGPGAGPYRDIPTFAPSSLVKDDRRGIREGDRILLVIEDDVRFSRILLDMARERGFKGLIAEDGETGLHFADFYTPDAIILDVELPGINGWTVMERLKQSAKTRHIPVHFLSVSDDPTDAMRMGAVGFFTKPVSVEKLESAFARIERIISSRIRNILFLVDADVQSDDLIEMIDDKDVQITVESLEDISHQEIDIDAFECIIIEISKHNQRAREFLLAMKKSRSFAHSPIIVYAGEDFGNDTSELAALLPEGGIIKRAGSPEQLLAETTLFLHRVESELSKEKQEVLQRIYSKDAVFEGKTILITDDDMRNLFALASVLEERGVRIVAARNGKECLEKLAATPRIDLILMDIMMPEMDGYETIRTIRMNHMNQGLGSKALPIIALTAKAMGGDRHKCIQAGASDYIAKPVDTDKLLSLLRVWLYSG